MTEGNSSDPMVVWDPEDKNFKVVTRVFSKLSALSKPLEIELDGNYVVRGDANDEYHSTKYQYYSFHCSIQ